MPFQRGDIVEVNLGMPPDGRVLNHPAVIISNDDVFKDDDCYLVVMLTSQQYGDRYTFEINENMLAQTNNKVYSEARCHLVTYILPAHIVSARSRNKLKRQYVDALVEHMVNSALY
jgi:hypothetical protein